MSGRGLVSAHVKVCYNNKCIESFEGRVGKHTISLQGELRKCPELDG